MIKWSYCFAYGVFSAFSITLHYNYESQDFDRGILETETFSLVYMIFCLAFLVIRLSVHAYLIKMALINQFLFRLYGHIKGYRGEIFLAIVYSIFVIGGIVYFHVFRPVIGYLINSSDFECSEELT